MKLISIFTGKNSDDEQWLALSESTAGLKLLEAIEELKCALSNDLAVKFSFSEGNVFLPRKVITQSEFERVLEENDILADIEQLVRTCLGTIVILLVHKVTWNPPNSISSNA